MLEYRLLLDEATVTRDFPLFNINAQRINTQFLLQITTTAPFMQFAQSCTSGTINRQRIKAEEFLLHEIPLPPLREQSLFVKAYSAKIREAIGKALNRTGAKGCIIAENINVVSLRHKAIAEIERQIFASS